MAEKKVFTTEHNYKSITLDEMIDFIEANYPNDIEWFAEVAYTERKIKTKDGKTKTIKESYNHLKAVKEFCKKYNPDLIPKAKPKKPLASDRLKKYLKSKD